MLKPQLIVDDMALKQNIRHVQQRLAYAQHLKPRLVVKSLACMSLIKLLSEQLNTQRFMLFHQPHIISLLENFPEADILLGKPMPAQEASNFYEQYLGIFDQEIQWLIDTKQRLQQYLDIAQNYSICLQINIEIDIGLHRGGVQSSTQLAEILMLIQLNPQHLKLSGLMGYDAHVSKLPALIKKPAFAYAESQLIYSEYQQLIQRQFPTLWSDKLCFNGGGSLSFSFHSSKSVCNDLSFGSMLLKPCDFDTDFFKGFTASDMDCNTSIKSFTFYSTSSHVFAR